MHADVGPHHYFVKPTSNSPVCASVVCRVRASPYMCILDRPSTGFGHFIHETQVVCPCRRRKEESNMFRGVIVVIATFFCQPYPPRKALLHFPSGGRATPATVPRCSQQQHVECVH
eukprot:m.39825 g.39825  ORF g.39825 m.39825 type:complete len:116 (+) comp32833_c0_seq2:153-500(+)